MSTRTLPPERGGMPIGVIRVSVLDGEDAGATLSSDEDAVTIGSAKTNHLILRDRAVSRFHLVLRREGPRILVRDLGSTNGTEIGSVVVRGGEVAIRPPATLRIGTSTLRIEDGGVVLVAHGPAEIAGVLGRAPVMRRLLSHVSRVAATDAAVLLAGESGTGKELIARVLHDLSPRADKALEIVDCGAIPPTLFASELFGHERGAFTGADRRYTGAFERARGGTLFLDEIAELAPEAQSALLGALERRRFKPVGSGTEITSDVRIISATSRELRAAVNTGRFRLDLYYRLAVVFLEVPPLRARREDVRPLADRFLAEAGATISADELVSGEEWERLAVYDWPGNVRELRNYVLGTLALGAPAPLLPMGEAVAAPAATAPIESYRDAKRRALDSFEREYVARLLARAEGNVRRAAREGMMDRKYLAELLKRHGIR